jgi:hypothetical protein
VDVEAVIFAGVVLAVALWPSIRAAQRRQVILAVGYAVASVVLVFVLPYLARNAWQAANPDDVWSLSAPVWLLLVTGPLTTVPGVLFATLLINLFVRPPLRR